MNIAVNAITAGLINSNETFFLNTCIQLAQNSPQHTFLFITYVDTKIPPASNLIFLHPIKEIKTPIKLKFWQQFKLPSILKKNKINLLLCNNYALPKSNIAQILFISDISFLNYPDLYKRNWIQFYKKNMPFFLHQAKSIVVPTNFIKQEILTLYKFNENKINVIPPFASEEFIPPFHWQQKETTKQQLTNGKEYFLYAGEICSNKNIINLLKAFSFFKMRQKSNMQLVLASQNNAEAKILKSISSYKYRNEVILIDKLSTVDLAKIVAATYAFVYPVWHDDVGTIPIQTLKCAAPLIVTDTLALKEICGEAALYVQPNNFNDIANNMMLLFKDEELRNRLIIKGREREDFFSSYKSISTLSEVINNLPS